MIKKKKAAKVELGNQTDALMSQVKTRSGLA